MPFNYSKLQGRIRECGFIQAELAEVIGMNKSTLSCKLNNQSVFTQTEITEMCKALNISYKDIPQYFFAV